MTSAAVAAIAVAPRVAKDWAPRILSRKYDSSHRPAMRKSGVTIGMGMTEKQGGTDVRANTSRGERVGEGIYRLTGHKWFMSAPMSDAFVMLAQTDGGMGCFLVPRILEDGTANGLEFKRLKDKVGNRSNASSEVEFADSYGFILGEPGAGDPHHPRHGHPDAARLRPRIRGHHAGGSLRRRSSMSAAATSFGNTAGRSADHEPGARRHGARRRRGRGAFDASGAGLRPGPRQRRTRRPSRG